MCFSDEMSHQFDSAVLFLMLQQWMCESYMGLGESVKLVLGDDLSARMPSLPSIDSVPIGLGPCPPNPRLVPSATTTTGTVLWPCLLSSLPRMVTLKALVYRDLSTKGLGNSPVSL